MTPQLKLFEPNFGSKIRRVELSGVMYFSILDVFKHYGSEGSASNPATYWKRVEKRLKTQGADITGLFTLHQFQGERQRPTPVAPFKSFLRFIQASEIPEWESIRQWMAEVANERIEESANPTLGLERAESRFIDAKVKQGMTQEQAATFLQHVQEGRIKRREWTDTLKAVVIDAVNYGLATNTEYKGLFGRDAKQIRRETGFKTARDGMTIEGRALLTAVEATLERLFRQKEHLTFTQALKIIEEVCGVYKISVDGVQQLLGIDLATGKPLLKGRQS